jgi:uncharacterized coiled-coil DUF342 family protein
MPTKSGDKIKELESLIKTNMPELTNIETERENLIIKINSNQYASELAKKYIENATELREVIESINNTIKEYATELENINKKRLQKVYEINGYNILLSKLRDMEANSDDK